MGRISIEAEPDPLDPNNFSLNHLMASSGAERELTSTSIIERYPLLTPEGERVLLLKAQAGDIRARDRLILSNLKFVLGVARKKCFKAGRFDLLDDFFQEGVIGLISAIETFDFNRGENPENPPRFLTHAGYYVRGAVNRCFLEQRADIREPEWFSYLRTATTRVIDLLRQKGLPVTPESIAQYLWQERVAGRSSLLVHIKSEETVLATVIRILTQPMGTISLDEGTDDYQNLYGIIGAPGPSTEDLATGGEGPDLQAALATMAVRYPKSAAIIRLKFGRERLTEEEITQRLGISRQATNSRLRVGLRRLKRLLELELLTNSLS